MLIRLMRWILPVVLSTAWLSAQTLTGAVQGVATDAQGAAVAGSAVQLSGSGGKLTAATDAQGAFFFPRLTPGEYDVRVQQAGFEDWTSHITVWSGEAVSLNVTLRVAQRQDIVSVSGEALRLTTESTEVSSTVTRRELAALPTNGRYLNRFALLNPHVRNTSGQGGDLSNSTRLAFNGTIFRETQYRLDGNSNYDTLFNNAPLQRLSMSAVEEFRVLTNQFNAEHGSTSTGLIITTTKSGTDEWHGETLFFARPSGIQARQPLATVRIPNQLLQGAAALGGPIRKGSTYFFANYEGISQMRGSFIASPRPDVYVGEWRDNLALVRLDHRFSDRHWLALRGNGQREFTNNPNDRVGGLMQASTATRSQLQTSAGQLTDTYTWGAAVNELRAGYINAVPSSTIPQVPQVGINRPGFSTEGGSFFSSLRTEVYQLADQLSWQRGAHTIKMGGDFIRRKVRDLQFDQFGTYTFAGGAPVPGQLPIQYSQRFGVFRTSYGQTQWAGFIQDSWRVRPRLTLNLGLRYDYQSLLDDRNNFGPRFGFSYDVHGNGNTVVRGGYGLYYDQPFFHGLTQRFLLNAVNTPFVNVTLTPADAAFPQFPKSLANGTPPANFALAPRNIVLRGDRLLSPYTNQLTLGVQQKIAGQWVASIDLIRSLTVKQFIHYDRNAAAPFVRTAPGQVRTVAQADRTRPLFDPARGISMFQGIPIRQLRQTENGGSAHFNAIDFSVQRRFANRYQLKLHYLLSSAINNITDDHLGANPQDFSDVGRGERAQSDFSQRHRFVGQGLVQLPWQLQFSGVVTLASGLPVNPLTGADNNGDGNVTDRPFGFARNAFRGTGQTDFDVSLSKTVRLSERLRVELRGDAFNIFNNSNFYRFNSVYGNGAAPVAAFLQPVGGIANVDPGRQFTFGARIVF